jgi:hypothetical protein
MVAEPVYVNCFEEFKAQHEVTWKPGNTVADIYGDGKAPTPPTMLPPTASPQQEAGAAHPWFA